MTTLVNSLNLPEINWKRFYFICILFLAVFAFLFLLFYVFGINDLTEGSYLVKNYHKEIANLSEENAKLETISAEIGFLGSIQEKAKELSFQKAKNIKYIQVAGGELVSAK